MTANASNVRVIGISLLVGTGIGVAAGTLFAIFFDRQVLYAIGAMLFITGLIALVMGLLGAIEPSEGWATGPKTGEAAGGRRSLAARVAEEHPGVEDSSGWALAAWGALVGLPLIALSWLAFYLAA